jgi:hypothetical protein
MASLAARIEGRIMKPGTKGRTTGRSKIHSGDQGICWRGPNAGETRSGKLKNEELDRKIKPGRRLPWPDSTLAAGELGHRREIPSRKWSRLRLALARRKPSKHKTKNEEREQKIRHADRANTESDRLRQKMNHGCAQQTGEQSRAAVQERKKN